MRLTEFQFQNFFSKSIEIEDLPPPPLAGWLAADLASTLHCTALSARPALESLGARKRSGLHRDPATSVEEDIKTVLCHPDIVPRDASFLLNPRDDTARK
jgi:hypothetical protein